MEVSIFVTGSGRGGFPCEYSLSEALSPEAASQVAAAGLDYVAASSKGLHFDLEGISFGASYPAADAQGGRPGLRVLCDLPKTF